MLQTQKIHVNYSGQEILDVPKLNFDISKIHFIVGPNGSGKTSLLKSIAGLLPSKEIELIWKNLNLKTLTQAQRSKIVAWSPCIAQTSFSLSVFDYVLLGRYPIHEGTPDRKDKDLTYEILRELQIAPLASRCINQISQGQAQMTEIARTLNLEAPVNLLDEPFANLDIANTLTVLKALKKRSDFGYLYLITIHDLNIAIQLTDDLTLVDHGTAKQVSVEDFINCPELYQHWLGAISKAKIGDKISLIYDELSQTNPKGQPSGSNNHRPQ
jgi:iron complex transport system ATP-binding protein